jgi:Outer membrane protein beta-barrel domain
MRRFVLLVFCVLCAGVLRTHAQVEPTATRPQFGLSAGAIGSVFQPDYAGNSVPESAPNALWGLGGYVDFRFRRWLQFEAEGRWLRFNQYQDIYEDNYLIGPRIPIKRYGRWTPYGKALFGWGKMNFQYNFAYGRFADIALGGGVDYDLNRRISIRVADFEYQLWPNWVNGTLKPYGGSVGVAYKIF